MRAKEEILKLIKQIWHLYSAA